MPVAGGRGRLERRGDVLAGLVLDVGEREAVLQRVGLLDVADGALGLLDRGGDALVALAAGAGRPLDVLVDPGAALPFRAVAREEVGEALGRARRVGAVDDGDVRVGQLQARVLAGDLGVVPLLDLAEVDVGERLAVELEPALDAGQVVGRGDRAEGDRRLDRRALLDGRDLLVLERRVRAGEVDRPGRELRDARRRSRPTGS